MNTRGLTLVGSVALAGLAILLVSCSAPAPSASASADRGKYIFSANGGCGCHGINLAGYKAGGPAEPPASEPFGELFSGPFGEVPARNITQDKSTGIGDWTDDQVVRAIREGVDKNGQRLFPIMPYNSFHLIADTDVRDLISYLRTVPAVSNPVPARRLQGAIPPVPQLPPSPPTAPQTGVERGQYLVSAVSICGECHTPQTPEGGPDVNRLLAGGLVPREGGKFEVARNITPDMATGIGSWTEQQIATLLRTGMRPDGSKVGGLMAAQTAGGYNRLSDADGRAIASYLKSIPAVNNVPRPPGSP